jgi:hypothetical protein
MVASYIAARLDDGALVVDPEYGYLQAKEDGIWYDHEARRVGFGSGEVVDAYLGNRTADPALVPAGLVGTLTQWFSWITNRIKAITGLTNWYDTPTTTLNALANGLIGASPGLKLIPGSTVIAGPGSATGTTTIAFNFAAAPYIVASVGTTGGDETSGIVVRAYSITTTGASLRWRDVDGLTPAAFTIHWIAMGTA